MIQDGRGLGAGSTLECDVLIVGAGAAGLALARGLVENLSRLDILVVEAGGRRFDFDEQRSYFAHETLTPEKHPPLELYRRRMLGGTTSVWGGRCVPLSPEDFTPCPEIGRIGWPISYDDVAAHYPKALEVLEAGANEFEARLAFPGDPAPLAPIAASTDLVLDQLERWSPPTDLGRRYVNVLERSDTIRVLLNTACVEVLTNDAGSRALGAVLRAGAKSFTVRAGATVLAAGGLETPRLLLWSRRARSCGLGNTHDHVGRYYMTHAVGDIGQVRFAASSQDLRLDYARSRDGVWCRRLILLSPEARRRHGLANFVLRPSIPGIDDPTHGSAILSSAFIAKRFLIPEYARRLSAMPGTSGDASPRTDLRFLSGHGANLVRGAPSLLRFMAFWARNRWLARRQIPSLFLESRSGAYPLEMNVEQFPDPTSRVRLGATLDPNGMPRIVLNWRLGSDFDKHIEKIYKVVGQEFQSAGLGEVRLNERFRDRVLDSCEVQGGHHIGTARMSSNSAGGVVDRNLEVWDTKGLYVLGPAVFPTSGFANPTLTIVALALRLVKTLLEPGRLGKAGA